MQTIPEKTVIVTGSNKGIGYWIIASMMKQKLPYNIIMCSRSQENGNLAISELTSQTWGLPYANRISCGVLDLTSNSSITEFKAWFSATHGKADVIVNNAGFAYKGSAFNSTVLKETFATNYDGTIYFQSQMEDLMSANGKLIYIASGAGLMTLDRLGQNLQARFMDKDLGPDGLLALKTEMCADLDSETFEAKGWTNWGYGLSKMF